MSQLIESNNDMKAQLRRLLDQQSNMNDDLGKREQDIVALKVELASYEERLKLKDEEVGGECFFSEEIY